ncbi:MAG: hypothetical protein FWC61_04440 [Proteobacteria bacterium]|nr:hypothetical protein [Pseudomonadota bacterium]
MMQAYAGNDSKSRTNKVLELADEFRGNNLKFVVLSPASFNLATTSKYYVRRFSTTMLEKLCGNADAVIVENAHLLSDAAINKISSFGFYQNARRRGICFHMVAAKNYPVKKRSLILDSLGCYELLDRDSAMPAAKRDGKKDITTLAKDFIGRVKMAERKIAKMKLINGK